MRDSSPARADSSTTGTLCSAGSARTAARRPKPSSCGIMTSLRIRSGVARCAAASACGAVRRPPRRHSTARAGRARTRACRRCRRRARCARRTSARSGDRPPGNASRAIGASAGADACGVGQPAQRFLDERARGAERVVRERGARRRSFGRCATPNGMRTRNVVPAPSVLAASIVPPCSFTSSCTSARPMPEPSCVRPASISTRWKRSKRRGSSASGMPTPVSATSSTRRAALGAHAHA